MRNDNKRSRIHSAFLLLVLALLTAPNLVRLTAQDPDLAQPMNPLGDLGAQQDNALPAASLLASDTIEQNDLVLFADPVNPLVNNNTGATGTSQFTQSETTVVAFGNTVVVGFNDSGSYISPGTSPGNKFTGFAYSTDGGATFTDGGTLPTNVNGDAGDPVLARDETTGRIYFATLTFSGSGIQVFHSDDNALTWSAPVNGTPGSTGQDKPWMAVDNFPGGGGGNVYVISRDFGGGNGIYFFRSTDNGATFGPNGGTLITAGNQGAFVTVGPDHSVYAFWWSPGTIFVRKSTDLGVTFGAPVAVATGLVGGVNGDLGLTGIRQGTVTAAAFRSNEFPHAAVDPVTGDLFVTYDNDPAGSDKADVFLVVSSDGGATWGAPFRVNDDATTTDQWMPTLAVAPNGSAIGVFYYSRQEDPSANNLFKYYGRIGSISGGIVTFAPSVAVGDTASLPEFGRDSVVNSVYMGDYNTAFATSSAFHITWSDNRDDLPGGAPRKDPNVYYAHLDLPAVISEASATPNVLWPPNHKMVNVTVDYTLTGPAPITTSLAVSSNEPVNGEDDGNTAPDWLIVDDHHVQLRAERSGTGTGRIYTITITATNAGGTTTQDVQVTVPLNKQ